MKKIKDILFVSYIKNKGLRRLCFVVGLCLCIWLLFNVIQDYDHETFKSLGYIFVFLLVLFYLPFLLICILKLVLKILKWIISGFIESNSSKKNAPNKRKRK